ncbi:MAG TPA: alpha/beta hydrolase-fold protein [Bacteriovoracaceae bacterium]|nr:alpha/beta hydrolase-fold protein [Bacteriovoracaceae bacterium]
MKIWFFLFLLLPVSAWSRGGEFTLAAKNFPSIHLQKVRDVHVYLPPGYEDKRVSEYPVLYMHDGQNLYDPKRAFMGQTWKAQETLNQLILSKKIRPLIVVGIDNTPERTNEYTHDADQDSRHGGGSADEYLKFMTQELLPFIQKNFRVKKDRESTAIMGSSLGGLVSLYAGLKEARTFGLVGALSPSLWWNRSSILDRYRMTAVMPVRIYIDSGTAGGEKPQDVLDFVSEFETRSKIYSVIQQGATHSETYWAKRFPAALEALFGQR